MEHSQTHEEHHPGPRLYVTIGVILAAVTAIEVAAFYLDITAWLLVMLLLGMSGVKFVLVVGYFMHLRFDDRRFLALFAIPLVIAASIMIALLGLFQTLTR